MPLRKAQPFTFRAFGVCDAVDGSNAPQGAMSQLANLVPNPTTKRQFVPRPAATQVTNFSGFTTPAQGEALLVVGTRAYGMIASARFAGKSEPFCYDLVNGVFVSIGNVTSANCPTSTATTGDWTPPTICMIGSRIAITHPGYDGVTNFVGWIDLRNFTTNTVVGDTNSNTTITNVHASPITAGVMVGDAISGAGIPANTYVTAMTATTITISNAATVSTPNTTFTITSGTTGAPIYGAGQTNGQPLAAVPVAVAQFNGRAYYAVNNGVQFSDALSPQQITNATQQLTLGDNTAVNALGGLPLANQVVGGTLQALIAFKQDSVYYQITGDPATNNLAANAVNGSVGTLAPNTICGTPFGLAYIAPDGLRIIGLDGKSSDPIGTDGDGVSVPFLYAVNPTRMCMAYDQNLLRVSVQNGFKNGQPVEEYWYDLTQKMWTGPHSFPASLIEAYHNGVNDFVLFASGINAKLWQSKTQPSATATYTENGAALSWVWKTTLMPDNEQASANQVVQTALGLVIPAAQTMTIMALDEQGATLDTITLTSTSVSGSIWGSFNWGSGVWGGAVIAYQEYTIPWHNALVFKQMAISINGPSIANFAIGNLYTKIQPTGYLGAH